MRILGFGAMMALLAVATGWGGLSAAVPAGHATAKEMAGVLVRTTNAALGTVDFVNAQDGWAAGTGIILATRDGGRMWYRVYLQPGAVVQLDMTGAGTGWALQDSRASQVGGASQTGGESQGGRASAGARLLRLSGQKWTQVPNTRPLSQVDFMNGNIGFGISRGLVVRTTSGGKKWSNTGGPSGVYSISYAGGRLWAAARRSVWVCDSQGRKWRRVFHAPISLGQGTVWYPTVRASGSYAWVYYDTNVAAASQSAYVIYATKDAGKTWRAAFAEDAFATELYPGAGTAPLIDSYPGPFAIGPDGRAEFAGACPACGMGTASLTVATRAGSRTVTIPGIHSAVGLSFPTAQQGWIVSNDAENRGQILHTTDGGRTWTLQFPTNGGVAPMTTLPERLLSPGEVGKLQWRWSTHLTTVWQDGQVRAAGKWWPLYVESGESQIAGGGGYIGVFVPSADSRGVDYTYQFVSPRAVGTISVSGFSDAGRVVRFHSSTGAAGEFNLANFQWTYFRSVHK